MEKIVVFSTADNLKKIFAPEHFERLSKLGELHIYDRNNYTDREYVLNFIKDSKLIITAWGSPKIDDEMIRLCPNLRGIIHAGGGIKGLLSDEFVKKGLFISSANGELADGVAESTVAIAVAACKGMFTLPSDIRNGLWDENRSKIKDFYDIKVGIVSVGDIGRRVIKLLKNYHVDILAYDPFVSAEEISELGAKKCEFEYLLRESDVISIHTPDIPQTDNMFNYKNLHLIKDGAVIINTARANVIDDDAFIEELSKNRFMAVLDVTKDAPNDKNHPYRKLPNVVLFPHIAGAVSNGCRRMGKFAVEETERLYQGEELLGKFDLSKLSIRA